MRGKIVTGQHSLYLDKMATMPLPMQSKLLRVLEDRRVRRIGSPREIQFDAGCWRVTNQNLQQMVKDGKFGGSVLPVERADRIFAAIARPVGDDIAALADAILESLNRKHQPGSRPGQRGFAGAGAHAWAGQRA